MPLYRRYRVPNAQRPRNETMGPRIGWRQILDRWDDVVLDLHDRFGADWDDPGLVRPWPWWRDRIMGLLTAPPVITAAGVFPATRLGWALTPPKPPKR